MRRVLLILGLIVLAPSPIARAAEQMTVALHFRTIADAGPNFSDIDISPSGNRILYVRCDTRHWWSFLPEGFKRFLTAAVGCKSRSLVIATTDGATLASMLYPNKRYWNPRLVGEDRIALYDYQDYSIRVFQISSGGHIDSIENRIVHHGLIFGSSPKVFGGMVEGRLYVAFEHPAGRIAVETLDSKDLHLLDGFHIEHANDVGLARNIVWFRVAVKGDVLDRYSGPAKVIARYPFPGGGGPGVEEAMGFVVFGPGSEMISAQIMDFFRRLNPAVPEVQDRSHLRYQIVDVSPNGNLLVEFDRSKFYLLEQHNGVVRPVEISVSDGLFPGVVADNGRMVAIERISDGDQLIKLGTPTE